MTDSFAGAIGRKVLSRATAEEVGNLTQLLVDVGARSVAQLVVGRGRKARLVAWAHVTGFGPDAVMLDDAASLEARDADAAVDIDLLGKRALSEVGNDAGKVDDVTFDPETGALVGIVVGSREHPAEALLGAGSYAAVLGAAVEEPAGED